MTPPPPPHLALFIWWVGDTYLQPTCIYKSHQYNSSKVELIHGTSTVYKSRFCLFCRWYDIGCILLKDPANNIELQTFSQATPVPSEYIELVQEQTPADYSLRWSGLAVTVGQVWSIGIWSEVKGSQWDRYGLLGYGLRSRGHSWSGMVYWDMVWGQGVTVGHWLAKPMDRCVWNMV